MELEDGTAYLYGNNCSFSRSCFQLGLRNGYDFLDGVVGGSTCDGARRLFDLWRYYIGTAFHHVLTVPRKYTQAAHDLYYHEVVKFKEHLEEYLGLQITDRALKDSIALYNESRTLLKRLYDFRKLDAPAITGAETMEVLDASFRMTKEQFNEHLTNLLGEIASSHNTHPYRARLMVTGSVMANPEFINSIETLGGLVVTDELCTSTRYWSDPVVPEGDEPPLRAIARRYLNNFPCARMVPSDERFNRILGLAKEFKVDGVISQIVRYCVPYAHDLPLLKERLNEQGIPLLASTWYFGTQVQVTTTRVQAFLEMLEGRKG
jgi:benzoyl-CoA reductase subunit C